MNYLSLLVITSALVVISCADKTLNLAKSGPKENKSFAETFAGILGAISFASVFTLISPILLKGALLPLFLILKIISKPFIMIGLTGYLMVALTPLILARSGMTSPVFESRSQSNDMISMMANILNTNMSVVTNQVMNFFELDNEECKFEMSCRVGKRVARALPYIQYFVEQSGAMNWVENKYLAKMFRSMTDGKDCVNICRSMDTQSSTTYSTDESNKTVFEWLG